MYNIWNIIIKKEMYIIQAMILVDHGVFGQVVLRGHYSQRYRIKSCFT
jgi:hypothetical protein